MSFHESDSKRTTLSDLKIQIGIMQKTLEYKEAELIQRSKELEKIHSELKRRENELERQGEVLKQQSSELTDLKIRLEVTKVELGQKKTTFGTRFLAVLVSVLFGAATILFNLGNSMITANPPDTKGNTLLFLAAIIYIAASVMTVFILGGSNK